MAESCRTLCKPVVELKEKVQALTKMIEELQFDRRAQDTIIRHCDTILNEVKNQYGLLTNEIKELKEKTDGISVMAHKIEELRKDYNEHEKQHNKDKNKASDRNWALWILLIGTILSSLGGLIFNLLK